MMWDFLNEKQTHQAKEEAEGLDIFLLNLVGNLLSMQQFMMYTKVLNLSIEDFRAFRKMFP